VTNPEVILWRNTFICPWWMLGATFASCHEVTVGLAAEVAELVASSHRRLQQVKEVTRVSAVSYAMSAWKDQFVVSRMKAPAL
jgi:hypothetical protein